MQFWPLKKSPGGFVKEKVAVEEHAGGADIATAVKVRSKQKQKPKKQPRYHVVLWDSNDHSYYYVIRMLGELFRHPLEQGYQLAHEVDKSGKAIVLTTTLEHAELKRDQIQAYGKDGMIDRCQGSMFATIEAVPED